MKKKIILIIFIIILSIIDIYFLSNYIFIRYKNKFLLEANDIKIAEELQNSPFKINKIILYSSASAKNKNTNFQDENWILDIYNYTDIAVFLNSKEAVKSLSISNVNLSKDTEKLYYLDANNFGTGNFNSEFEISNSLDFSVLNFDNSDNSIAYNTPVFFADSSNPITLKFVNTIYKNYTIKNTEKLNFNGTLLKQTPVKLDKLKTKISFKINISTYDNENFEAIVNLEPPIQNEMSSLLDGFVFEENESLDIPFFKN